MSKYSCDCGSELFNIVEDDRKLIVVCAKCGEKFDENMFVFV